jgi:PAS domain S-box-containing protein
MTLDEKVNILMVDDHLGKLLTYEAILAGLGENLIQATSARQALEILMKTDVAVVLMDVSMPELDGFELADMIRQHPRFQKTAIIFISGVHLSESDTINGYRRGAVDYISVPVVPEVLRAKVGVFVDLHRKTRMLERLNNELEQRVDERTEELRQSEEQFRTLANSIPQLAWMAESEGNVIWYNQRWCDLAGVSMETLLQTGWAHLRHPEHRDRVQQGIEVAKATGSSWEDTFPIQTRNGDYSWFLCRAVPILDSEGHLVRWFGTGTDVSEHIAAEERIRLLNQQMEERLEELETIMQALPVGVAMSTDPALASLTANQAFREIFGETFESPGSTANTKQEPGQMLSPLDVMQKAIQDGAPVTNAEMQLQGSDGEQKHLLASASPLAAEGGRVRGAVGVFFDISHRRQLEETLRERAELLELASEAIMVRDLDGCIRYWNTGAERLYGWRREEAMGKKIHALLQTAFPVSEEEVNLRLQSKGSWQGRLTQRTRDGREVVVACQKALDRQANRVLEINRDITGELRAEEALRHTERLAAMGRMAGIIAHEINNPLESITNTFYLLRHHPSLDKEAQYYASLAEQELERASHITRQTLSFYRESKEPVRLSLVEIIQGILELQARAIEAAGIVAQTRFDSQGIICGHPVELRQIFLNLIGNAVQAMDDGGTLRVRVSDSIAPSTGRRGVAISIVDTGIGIRGEDASRLFQPFFSTKSTKGTGLGLWISKGIVQKYDGQITFRSHHNQAGNATCFRVFLPSDTEMPASSTNPARAEDQEVAS